MQYYFDHGTIVTMTRKTAEACAHQGACDDDVEWAIDNHKARITGGNAETIRRDLEEYGAWDAEELADDAQNLRRIVWIAAGNILDELRERSR